MFKKFLSNKKRTMLLCAVLIFGVMLGVGAKIIMINAAELQTIEFKDSGGRLNMKEGQIINLKTGEIAGYAANVPYVNSVANGEVANTGIWQSLNGNAYLNDASGFFANLGIGTSDPQEELEVRNDATGNDGDEARIRVTDLNDNPELQLQYGTGDNDHWGIYSDQSDDSLNIWSYNGAVANQGDRITISQSGDMTIAGDLTVVDAFTINGVLTADSGIVVTTGGVTATTGQICDVNGCIGDVNNEKARCPTFTIGYGDPSGESATMNRVGRLRESSIYYSKRILYDGFITTAGLVVLKPGAPYKHLVFESCEELSNGYIKITYPRIYEDNPKSVFQSGAFRNDGSIGTIPILVNDTSNFDFYNSAASNPATPVAGTNNSDYVCQEFGLSMDSYENYSDGSYDNKFIYTPASGWSSYENNGGLLKTVTCK